jgi:hypothetical protein
VKYILVIAGLMSIHAKAEEYAHARVGHLDGRAIYIDSKIKCTVNSGSSGASTLAAKVAAHNTSVIGQVRVNQKYLVLDENLCMLQIKDDKDETIKVLNETIQKLSKELKECNENGSVSGIDSQRSTQAPNKSLKEQIIILDKASSQE